MQRSNLYAIGAQKNLCFTNATQRPTRASLLDTSSGAGGQAACTSASSPVARKVNMLAEHKTLVFIELCI